MPKKNFCNNRGSTLVLVTAITFLGVIFAAVFTKAISHRTEVAVDAWSRFTLRETAQSAFVLMESAMKRRLFEAPPETRLGKTKCAKRLDFSLEGETDEGIEYRVDAVLEPINNILEMVSRASLRGTEVVFRKELKLYDVSKYLAFSKSKSKETLVSDYLSREPVSMIAGDRKVYFEGHVSLSPHRIGRPNPESFSSPQPMDLLGEIAFIFQAERFHFLGGISYRSFTVKDIISDTTNPPAVYSSLAPYLSAAGPRYEWQDAHGGALFTANASLANTLFTGITNQNAKNFPSRSEILKNIYPISLFSAPLPMNAQLGNDSGMYVDSPDRWTSWKYRFDGDSRLSRSLNFTCYTEPNVPESLKKYCSSSLSFPNGFRNWKRNSGLDGVLYASESSPIDFPTLDWDNLGALEEDAGACGLVIDQENHPAISRVIEDCDMSDKNMLLRYLDNPSANPCGKVSELDSDVTSSLPSFSSTACSTTGGPNACLRRVLYTKVPLLISQKDNVGLWRNLPNGARRSNFSAWIVAEKEIVIQPFQPDLSRAVDDPAGASRIRDVYFNGGAGSSLSPINFVFLTPEKVEVITPQHRPVTYEDLKKQLVVQNGKFRPTYSILTDEKHQGADGFLHGVRRINVNGVSLMSGSTTGGFSEGFVLRGLWSGHDGWGPRYIGNACLFDIPGDNVGPKAYDVEPISFPPLQWAQYANQQLIPPMTSKFYRREGPPSKPVYTVSKFYMPYVFQKQLDDLEQSVPVLRFEGLRIVGELSSVSVPNKRNLRIPLKNHVDYLHTDLMDISDRKYTWAEDFYFEKVTNGSCQQDVASNEGNFRHVPRVYVNKGDYTFIHQSPPDAYRGLGSISATELPSVQVSH